MMNRYMIESPHVPEKCTQVVNDLNAAGYLHFFDWGCKDNNHTGWAIIEAESREHARQIIPWYLRDQARIVQLVKFSAEEDEHSKKS